MRPIHLPVEGHPELRAAVRLGERSLDPNVWLEVCASFDRVTSGERHGVDGLDVALKAGPIAASGARRFRWRRALTGRRPPAEAEFEHLAWLRERLFEAPEPLVAVTIERRGTPLRQLLATLWIEGGSPFEDAWSTATQVERTELAGELGRELGRMHALGFLHGDAYPRNVLVRERERRGGLDGRRLVFLDAWAGGPSAWPRGPGRSPSYDLGSWFSRAADWMDRADQRTLLGQYLGARRQNGHPVTDERRLFARIAGARRAELARLERSPARLRGRPFPVAGWCPPEGEL